MSYRKSLEEQQKNRLRLAWQEVRSRERQLSECQLELSRRQGAILAGEWDLTALLVRYTHLEKLRQERTRQELLLEESRGRLAECRRETLQAMRARRVLERLRERRLREYFYQMGREEQALLDETGGSARLRKKIETQRQQLF